MCVIKILRVYFIVKQVKKKTDLSAVCAKSTASQKPRALRLLNPQQDAHDPCSSFALYEYEIWAFL